MIRTFCDNCGAEITEANPCNTFHTLALPMRLLRDTVTATISVSGIERNRFGNGKALDHVCLQCITDAMSLADKRVKPVQPVALNDADEEAVRKRLRFLTGNENMAGDPE